MNSLSAFIVLGLILMYIPLIVVPTANISSEVSDTAHIGGVAGFTFGNMGFTMVLCLLATLFWWMFVK
jgi:hypothetical protein